jgi:hypothetical protein
MIDWEPLGRIIKAKGQRWWMNQYTGATFAEPLAGASHGDIYNVYVTSRDKDNQSQIGIFKLDLSQPLQPLEIAENPVIVIGSTPSFNSSGNAYPWIVTGPSGDLLFFVGWKKVNHQPFMNQIGLAVPSNGNPKSRHFSCNSTPIFPESGSNKFGTGSCCVLNDDGVYKMWFTDFLGWQKDNKTAKIQPRYHIKYATSHDSLNWKVSPEVAIDFSNANEYAICRPSVILLEGIYHMWFCARGKGYNIYHATSLDGLRWSRDQDPIHSLSCGQLWADQEQCYPFVFKHDEVLYMLYGGNNFGCDGLGIARGLLT